MKKLTMLLENKEPPGTGVSPVKVPVVLYAQYEIISMGVYGFCRLAMVTRITVQK
ncbi:hypothetical protein [Paenibacillus sp. BJ-4]|uniref:hypothetical protein n=1 Tax=Paenibacillus sp. BJ-4 TaxID=2878097 RepID=UPI001CF01CBF|nr:hypothetical protein [Paenibacillus sp. BJ-4]